MATPRVAPPRVFPTATGAGKPPADPPGPADAYRQTTFVLGGDVELVLRGLGLEAGVAEASSGAKHRTQRMAAVLGPWSRGWLCRLEALHAVQWGNYVAALPLIRAAADLQGAAVALARSGGAEWEEWLAEGGVGLAPAEHAGEYRLHPFRSGAALSEHATLGPVYRMATDLSLPHFGATLLLAGHGSDAARVVMTFGDRDFHLGLAELCLGWLVQMSAAMCEDVQGWDAFAIAEPEKLSAFAAEARRAVADGARCRMEAAELEGVQRYLVHNWRAKPGAATKKVLL